MGVPDVILTASMQVGGQTSCTTTSAPTSATTFPPKTRKSRRFKLMTSPWLKLRSLLLKNPPRLKTPGANPIAWIICARISIKAASIQVTSKLGVTVFVEWIVLCARQIAQAIFEAILVPDVILTASMQVGGQTSCTTTSAPTSATTFPKVSRRVLLFRLLRAKLLLLFRISYFNIFRVIFRYYDLYIVYPYRAAPLLCG